MTEGCGLPTAIFGKVDLDNRSTFPAVGGGQTIASLMIEKAVDEPDCMTWDWLF